MRTRHRSHTPDARPRWRRPRPAPEAGAPLPASAFPFRPPDTGPAPAPASWQGRHSHRPPTFRSRPPCAPESPLSSKAAPSQRCTGRSCHRNVRVASWW
ncbi:hypothetical protein DT603_04225 [Pseudoxanthomonas gei]|uniref:Uncharacterized protein n=1 Tax=Pseudoxanthomonas gei TaxID=1383030 RepID=A0ABX0A987_9GAMM|nr:hypothetical protein [Pseudoxanthomonas gei]